MLKRLRFPLFLLLSCLVFGAADCLSQSPVDGFFKGKDNLQLVVGTGAENNSKFEAGSGTISLPQTQIHFAVAGIYGINDRFDAVLSLPLVANGDQVGLQDGRLSLKYGLAEIEMDKSSLSFQLAASLSTPLTAYETESSKAIGQQATSIEIRPIVHFMTNNGWFATAQFMAAQKSDPTPNAIGGNFKIGRAMSKDYFDLWFDLMDSDGEFNYRGIPTPPSFSALSPDHQKVGGTYYRQFKDKMGGYLGLSQTLGGLNVRLSTGVSIGAVITL